MELKTLEESEKEIEDFKNSVDFDYFGKNREYFKRIFDQYNPINENGIRENRDLPAGSVATYCDNGMYGFFIVSYNRLMSWMIENELKK